MKEPSDLERYLREQENEGQSVSEGAFTISRDEALAKLSKFQLPFQEAWVVKMVQAGVAHPTFSSLNFILTHKESLFKCKGNCRWTLDEVEEALLDPNYSEDRGLLHLVTALRVVGFAEKRAFWLEIPGLSEKMVWDGSQLSRMVSERTAVTFEVVISLKGLDDDGGFFGLEGRKIATRRNAAASQNLHNICHTCPKPLSLDGARIEGLEMNPNHGWGGQSQLMAMGFGDGVLPELKVPPRTVSRSVVSQVSVEETLSEVTAEQRNFDKDRKVFSIAYLVSAHLARVKSGKQFVWQERQGQSLFYWVQDGVVIFSEPMGLSPDFCSVGCYVSAEGLDTDLTGFSLLDSPDKQIMIDEARRLLRIGLAEVHTIDFEEMIRKAQKKARGAGVFFAVLGVGAFFVSPLHSILFGGLGFYSFFTSSSAGVERTNRFTEALSRLCAQV